MPNLNGSIKSTINLIGNTTRNIFLDGTSKTVYSLIGTVESFITSLTIRIFIRPVANIYAKFHVYRNIKLNTNITSNINVLIYIFRNLKSVFIKPSANISISAHTLRNIKININANPIFGYDSTLGILDALTLDEIDSLTLGELEFTQGIHVSVLKNARLSINGISDIQISMYTIRYTKLLDLDDLTLDEMDSLTLGELDETVN